MQISGEGKLGILVGLIGLAGAGAIMLAPEQRWIGWTLIAIALTGGIGLGVYAFVEERRTRRASEVSKLGPLVIMATGLAIFGVGVAWYFRPPGRTAGDHQSTSSSVSLAHLAELGWSLQRQPNGIQFVASGSGPLPDMAKSAPYFAQLPEAFSLLFSGTNGIEGLHHLSDLTKCAEISINAGTFTDVSELRGFTNLIALYISQTPINGLTTVDLSPLSSLTTLQKLILDGTKATTITPLGDLKNLHTLSLRDTLVSDLSPASAFESLEFLDITNTRIVDLHGLDNLENLTELNIGAAQLPGLSSLRNSKSLQKLMIIDQTNTDLSSVGDLLSIESLTILGPSQLDISPLRNLHKLHNIMISGLGFRGELASVTSLQVIGELKELKQLSLGQLQISDLNFVSKLDHLEEVNLNRLPIQSIELLRNLKYLKKLSLNYIQVLDISPLLDLPQLSELSVIHTPARADVLSELERRGVRVSR
jgi:hypothetical protein